LFDAAWFAASFGLGCVLERLLAKATRSSPVIQRRILLALTIVLSGFLAWVTMHNSFEPEFTVGPNTRLDPNTPPSFWLVYPFAQIGNLLFYIFGFRLGIFLSQRKHLAPGEELVWPASRFVPRMRESLRNLANTWDWSHAVVAIVFVWCCACILLQDRTLAGKAIVSGLVLIFFLGWMFPRIGQYRWALLSALIATALLVRAGSYHMGIDIALFSVGLTTVFWYFHLAKPRPQARLQIKAFLATILLTWLLWLLDDAISSSGPAPRNFDRFAALGAHEDVVGGVKRIGIALSGGGYRATLMHAGVLDGLEKLGLRPTNLSAVSGGSITASYHASGGATGTAACLRAAADAALPQPDRRAEPGAANFSGTDSQHQCRSATILLVQSDKPECAGARSRLSPRCTAPRDWQGAEADDRHDGFELRTRDRNNQRLAADAIPAAPPGRRGLS